MSVNLKGNILVTGTNRGIGLEFVKQLAEKTGPEAQIYASCRDPEGPSAEALRDLANRFPGKITPVKFDITNEDSISAAFQAVSQKLGATGLNLLINNAGINKPAAPGSLSATRKQDMMEVYETNVAGPFVLTKVFLPLLQKAANTRDEGDDMSCRRSAIINMSSVFGSVKKCPETFQRAQMYPYRTSKAALNMLTCCQAEDFRRHGILVMAMHPGWVQTDMGGEQACLTPEESVAGMLHVMSTLSNKDSGLFLDWEGNTIPW